MTSPAVLNSTLPTELEISDWPVALRASHHDRRMRELEKQQVSTWSEMAQIAIAVRDGREWETLGFESFNQWLKDAAPQSRAAIYAGIGLISALDDVAQADLKEIPQSTAKVLKSLPRSMRRKPEVIEKAKRLPPRQFVQEIQEQAPELHIERVCKRSFTFESSQEKVIDAGIEMANLLEVGYISDDKPLTDEQALEKIVAEWMQTQQIIWDQIRNGEVVEV